MPKQRSRTKYGFFVLFRRDSKGERKRVGDTFLPPQRSGRHRKRRGTPYGIVACNELNAKFRWVKFYIKNDRNVIANMDAEVDEVSCGEECLSLVNRVVSIVDESYPDIMKALWA